MATELRVAHLEVFDVLGIRELKVAPGKKTTVFSGRNGSSKTSAIASLLSTLTGGNLGNLARVGAEGEEIEPRVVLVLDGPGTERYRVERTAEKVRVRERVGDTAAFQDVPKPQAFLSQLFDARGANPVAFLNAKDSDRALMLLEALPLQLDRPALLKEMGIDPASLSPIPEGLHPLETCALIRKDVYDRRTAVNVQKRQAADTVEQLRREIPAEMPTDPAAAIKTLEDDTTRLASELGAAETKARADEEAANAKAHAEAEAEADKIEAAFNAFKQSEFRNHERQVAEWRAELERKIAADLAETNGRITTRKEEDEQKLRALDATEATAARVAKETRDAAEAALVALRNTIGAKREQLAGLRGEGERLSALRALEAQANKHERERDRLDEEGAKLSAALDVLDAYRRRMADNLPIAGLSIEGKVIKVGGVPFEQLNMQQRIDIAVQVAVLRAKGSRLPVVFIDGAEALDQAHFEALAARLEKEGVQAFIARVEDSEFTVTKDGVPA
jgi:flagellar biosynthesis GTPase FlhF